MRADFQTIPAWIVTPTKHSGWSWQYFGILHERKIGGGIVVHDFHVHYWSVVITLILLSAYLLLGQPRKRTGTDHA